MNDELTIGRLATAAGVNVEQRIADLTRMRRMLRGLMAECAAGQRPRSCPIITTLAAGEAAADG